MLSHTISDFARALSARKTHTSVCKVAPHRAHQLARRMGCLLKTKKYIYRSSYVHRNTSLHCYTIYRTRLSKDTVVQRVFYKITQSLKSRLQLLRGTTASHALGWLAQLFTTGGGGGIKKGSPPEKNGSSRRQPAQPSQSAPAPARGRRCGGRRKRAQRR